MKVLHILYRLMPSGAEKMLADSADLFRQNGVEGIVLVNDTEYGPYADTLRSKGYTIYKIPYSCYGWHLVGFWILCRKEKFDAVHIHVIRGFASFAAVAKLAGVRRIIKTFHSIFEPSGMVQAFMQRVRRWIAKLSGAKFVAISKSVQENELRLFGIKTTLVWNFADERMFALADVGIGRKVREELNIPDGSFVLLTVGNCHSEGHMAIKNHALIIKAIALLPEEIKERIVYLHAGAEMAGFPERKLAESLNVSRLIRFLGSRNDIWRLLCASNEFVMTSTKEGISISCIEAALSGRHMILTHVPGLVDYAEVLSDVSYVDARDPSVLAKAIEKRFHLHGVEPGNVSIRTAAMNVFSIKVGIESLLKIYKGNE